VRHDPDRRWYTRLLGTDTVEVWLLGTVAPQAATSVHAYSPPGLPLRFGVAGAASPVAAELLGAAR
jgi:hypothetical protein